MQNILFTIIIAHINPHKLLLFVTKRCALIERRRSHTKTHSAVVTRVVAVVCNARIHFPSFLVIVRRQYSKNYNISSSFCPHLHCFVVHTNEIHFARPVVNSNTHNAAFMNRHVSVCVLLLFHCVCRPPAVSCSSGSSVRFSLHS